MTAPALIRRIARRCLALGVVLLCAGTPPAFGAALQDPKDAKSPQEKPSDVTDIDLDELMKVHVTTAGAKDTQGGIAVAGGGTEERVFGGARYGAKAGEDAYVRVYGKYYDRDDALDGANPDNEARDGAWMARGGFRSDWKGGEHDRFTLM